MDGLLTNCQHDRGKPGYKDVGTFSYSLLTIFMEDKMSHHHSGILIHIGDLLDDNYIHQLETQIGFAPGIYSACVNVKARHLMRVDYDPETVRASEILSQIKQSGLHAELIGL